MVTTGGELPATENTRTQPSMSPGLSAPFEVFANQDTTVIHGDALKVLRDYIPDRSVDLIFADPPYNIGKQFANFTDVWPSEEAYAEWCYIWLDLCVRKLKKTGSIYIMSSTQSMPYIDLYLRKYVTVLSRIVWHYDSSGVQAKKYFGSLYEPILFCVREKKQYTFNSNDIRIEAKTGSKRSLIDYRRQTPKRYNTSKVPGNVWYISRVRYRMDEYEQHPSQKPEALLERIIKASSNQGDIVLDPFSGTFTTSSVAKRLSRKSIGIELQREFIKIGLRRLSITDSLDGESLTSPTKSYKRRQPLSTLRLIE